MFCMAAWNPWPWVDIEMIKYEPVNGDIKVVPCENPAAILMKAKREVIVQIQIIFIFNVV